MKMIDALENLGNVAYTENGAQVFDSTKSALLDFFSLGGALRNTSKDNALKLFSKARAEDELRALKAMFYFRDVRGGQGQRQAFRDQMRYMAQVDPYVMTKNLELVAELGRWDDLYALMDTDLETDALMVMWNQLVADMENMDAKQPISLLAKWLKSENASSPVTKALARKTRKYFEMSSKEYRKMLSEMRAYIDVVERKTSAGDWEGINYSAVPSNAMMKYRKAFDRHDHDRFDRFINAALDGEEKVNASVLYPYEIVEKVLGQGWGYHSSPMTATDAKALEAMWKALPDYVAATEENAIAVVDTSGSMSGTPMNVAVSLGLYLAERASGPYKDRFITFSSRPDLQKVEGRTFVEKVRNLQSANWDMSTNLEAVFNLILKAAIENDLSQDEMLDKLYIISDMQFNAACHSRNVSFFDAMRQKFDAAGYKMPLLVFWNVDARDNMKAPMNLDQRGFLNVSGFSPSVFKALMDNEILDAYQMMLKVLDDDRYNAVTL